MPFLFTVMICFFNIKYRIGVKITTKILRKIEFIVNRSSILVVVRKKRNKINGSRLCSSK